MTKKAFDKIMAGLQEALEFARMANREPQPHPPHSAAMTRTEALHLAPIMAETFEAHAAAIERDGPQVAAEIIDDMDWPALVQVLRVLAKVA